MEAAEEVAQKQKKEVELLKDMDLTQFNIKGSEQEWGDALKGGAKGVVSLKG